MFLEHLDILPERWIEMSSPYFLDWIDQNCTRCESFEDIWLATDTVLRDPVHQEIKVTCKVHGIFSNKKLYVCEDFKYDSTKPEIVYEEKRAGSFHKRFFARIGSIDAILKAQAEWKAGKSKGSVLNHSLDEIIYGFVCRVTDIDVRGYQMSVCIQRVHLQTGISKEAIFKEIMRMISEGLLVRDMICGGVFLRPPSAVSAIADVLQIVKRKVLV